MLERMFAEVRRQVTLGMLYDLRLRAYKAAYNRKY